MLRLIIRTTIILTSEPMTGTLRTVHFLTASFSPGRVTPRILVLGVATPPLRWRLATPPLRLARIRERVPENVYLSL